MERVSASRDYLPKKDCRRRKYRRSYKMIRVLCGLEHSMDWIAMTVTSLEFLSTWLALPIAWVESTFTPCSKTVSARFGLDAMNSWTNSIQLLRHSRITASVLRM